MSAPVTAGSVKKICVKCGKDVSGAPRMKDKDGKYWCVPCGEEDRRHQHHAAGGICESCGESFSPSVLLEIGGKQLCPRCRRIKYSKNGGGGNPPPGLGFFTSIKSLFGKK